MLGQRRRRARELAERQLALSSPNHEGPPANVDPPVTASAERPPIMQFGLLTPPSTLPPPHEPQQQVRRSRRRTTLGHARQHEAAQRATTSRSIGQRRRRQRELETAVNSGMSKYLIRDNLICSLYFIGRSTVFRRGALFLAGRKPYEDPPQRHDLGRMDSRCTLCGARHWLAERLSTSSKTKPRFGMCCLDGEVSVSSRLEPPQLLRTLLTSVVDDRAKKFRKDIWQYNRALSFTSLGVREDRAINDGTRAPVFRISGELCHRSGALEPANGEVPQYAQLYVYDPQAALETRIERNTHLDAHIMGLLQDMLNTNHQYVPLYRQAYEILQTYDPANDVEVYLRFIPGQLDRRRYNLPTADDIAVILPGQNKEPRDIVLRQRAGPLHRISDLHPAYVSLQYPLLFPFGEHGWHPGLRLRETEAQENARIHNRTQRRQSRRERGIEADDDDDEPISASRRLTLMRYVAYCIQYRGDEEFNSLLYGGRLFERYLVDMYASIDQQRLQWIELNQDTIRADRFNNLEDAMTDEGDNLDLNDLGRRIILPSSYIGGPRNMHQCFQDSMAIARFYRKVDIFLTMTTDPEWPEITRELLPGQTAYDRPELVARVFQLKKKALLDYIYKDSVLGPVVAYVYTIEFQKRGLPHMHCLIFLKEPYKLMTPDDIDSCIWARWPNPTTQPALFETVKKSMIHGPCGDLDPKALCMDPITKKCTKGYPKDFQPFTTLDPHGYPLYYRPDDGRAYEVRGHMLDNRWVVPYSPFLCSLFSCHINVECAVSLGSFKYAFKYVHKGPDQGMLEINQRNEVQRFATGRYITAPDASWHILSFKTHKMVPNVIRLQVHLEGHHMVTFRAGENLQDVIQRGLIERTTLTAFFEANADLGTLGEEAHKYTYQEFPQHFVYNENSRLWKIRQKGFALGRMYFIKPSAGEQFYLRTLLTVVKGARSFEDLRRVPGHNHNAPYPTYHAACLAHGLLEDDGEWRICLQEAADMCTGTRLRHLFVTLLLFSDLAQPDILWTEFRVHICDDLHYRLRAMGIAAPSENDVYDYGLFLLDKILGDSGHSLEDWPSMPKPQKDWTTLTMNPLIAEQIIVMTSSSTSMSNFHCSIAIKVLPMSMLCPQLIVSKEESSFFVGQAVQARHSFSTLSAPNFAAKEILSFAFPLLGSRHSSYRVAGQHIQCSKYLLMGSRSTLHAIFLNVVLALSS